ncbi:MAG TPA: type III pantothenate kinase [Elusimicrobiota bacterium]|nr:type III pantothenate kinase [Elusimicrobiota bacterium]
MATVRTATSDEYGTKILDFLHYASIESSQIGGVALASVVPPLDGVFLDAVKKYFKTTPLVVGPGVKTGMNILYDNAAEVGADRIVNALAAFDRLGGPCIVVDFGTATTFDCVNRKGDYLGGAIAPGPLLAAASLWEKTAKLPLLGAFRKPPSALGKNTHDSMSSGLFYGYIGLTEELLRQLKKEVGGEPKIMATGGLAGLLAPYIKAIKKVDPDLTLEGLRLVWERNL